jgi:lysophospholipase L1-like esterase
MNFSRWATRAVGVVAVAAVALAIPPMSVTASGHHGATRWLGAWAAAQLHPLAGNAWDGPNWSLDGFTDQSVRQVVRVSAGGSQVRIRLSNRFGSQPLRIAGATIAKTGMGATVRPGTLRSLTFGHRTSTTIPVGAQTTSDAAQLPISTLESVTITLYFTGSTGPATFHEGGMTTTYRAAGDRLYDDGAEAFGGETSHSWYYLTGVDVIASARTRGTVVAFGDSITDGFGTTPNTNSRYPDQLATRIAATRTPVGVVNAGVSGNKLLADSPCYGEKGLTRFQRDVLDQPGVRTVIVLEGTNDIGAGGYPDFGCGASALPTDKEIIEAHRALIRAAHARGVTIIGATITPMKGFAPYYSAEKEDVRNKVNSWIRTSGAYDSVVDLDKVLANPADPAALRPEYDSGDGLHPNNAGAQAIAAAIRLTTL